MRENGEKIEVETIMEVEFSYYDKYLKIALDNYENIGQLKKEVEGIWETTKHIEKSSDQEAHEVALKYYAMEKHAIIAVIFSALSSEAYINHYAISRLSKNYFKTYLDKLDLKSKCPVIQELLLGFGCPGIWHCAHSHNHK